MVLAKKNTFSIWFIITGVITQIATYLLTNSCLLSLISGVFGVVSVVLASERKLSMYVFGFLQLGTYIILAIRQNLYGELGENIFYAATMVLGLFVWMKNRKDNIVIPKKLSAGGYVFCTLFLFAGSICLGSFLENYTNDTQPYLDAISTIPAIIAQLLMIFRYREQWLFWLIVDVATCILWIAACDWCMAAQYIFWTVNCGYGWYMWSKN